MTKPEYRYLVPGQILVGSSPDYDHDCIIMIIGSTVNGTKLAALLRDWYGESYLADPVESLSGEFAFSGYPLLDDVYDSLYELSPARMPESFTMKLNRALHDFRGRGYKDFSLVTKLLSDALFEFDCAVPAGDAAGDTTFEGELCLPCYDKKKYNGRKIMDITKRMIRD